MHIPATLPEWLDYIERIHPKDIDLGLERVRDVVGRLSLRSEAIIFTVAGTNGKGSTCSVLEAILLAAGYAVGLYSSPHLLRYNERVRLNGKFAGDEALCKAFASVEAARASVPLTYFEFGTLAAWVLFAGERLDAVILEVGMGGRLDAVNLFDTDCAIITSIGIDHVDYLGDNREQIGFEKAGILRAGRPAIVADPDPPTSVVAHARSIGAKLKCIEREFGFVSEGERWRFWDGDRRHERLPLPALRGACQLRNASACLAALNALGDRLPVSASDVCAGLAGAECPGRFQVLRGHPTVVLDVAHNPQAAEALATNLDEMGAFRVTHAVFGMLRDKDIAGVCAALRGRIDSWYAATLSGARGAEAAIMAEAVIATDPGADVQLFVSPRSAFEAAFKRAGGDDRIVAFGSFYTVAEVMASLASGLGG